VSPRYTALMSSSEIIALVGTAAGLGWASGLRLYAVLFFLGTLHRFGAMALPPGLEIVAHPAVIAASGIMFLLEFGADKIPGFDSLWDAFHTFVRIPGGALLAAGAVADQSGALTLAAAILGGTLAAGAHLTKAGSRALINTSPEPFSNWSASLTEDALVAGAVWFSLAHPFVMIGALFVLVGIMAWLLPRIWRGVRRMFSIGRRVFGMSAGSSLQPTQAAGGKSGGRSRKRQL
jgi:hypothetical protein